MTTGPDARTHAAREDNPVHMIDADHITPPPWPRQAALQMALSRTRQLLGRRKKPFMADDRLRRPDWLAAAVQQRSPVCVPALAALTQTLNEASKAPDAKDGHCLVMLPPCDDSALLTRWAADRGHACLCPPAHDALLTREEVSITLPPGDGILVIPDLAAWCLRHQHGLRHIRALLEQLAARKARRCVIGCNSWTWSFLCRAVQADLMLPPPLTLSPLEEVPLRHWFAEVAHDSVPVERRFRLSGSGRDLLALNAGERPGHDYFKQLAARSLGIPWVAWHLWQRSLRERIEPDDKDDRNTLWVVALEEISLPGGGQTEYLLILHALLIHGALPHETLEQVLPDMTIRPLLHALEANGYIACHNGWYHCQPGAYPAIRRGLEAAGFPMDLYG